MNLVSRRLPFVLAASVVFWLAVAAWAQDAAPASLNKKDKNLAGQQDPATQQDPLKRPLTEKQRKENEKALRTELGKTYKKWLDEEVRWIITDEEREAFKKLSNDEERDQFIEAFWLRRDPTPDTVENEFKEEHYRRIAYANERFAAGIPGWKTDRGRMYVMFGPADEIESHPSGGAYQRPAEEGGGTTSTYPFETWRYRYLEGIGQEVIIEFVDTCMCGDYHMTIDRSEKDALLNVPGAGLTDYEAMGLANKSDRFSQSGLERLGTGAFTHSQSTKQFDRLEQWAKLNKPPPVKFKDLEEIVNHKISYNLLPFDLRTDFLKVGGDTVLMPLTLQVKNRDVTWQSKEGVQRMVVNIFGRVTSMTGRIVQTFEDTVTDTVPDDLLPRVLDNAHLYWKAVPLRPGRYKLDLVVKDINGDRTGTWTRGITVPDYPDDRLSASSLIVADQMEKVASKNIGSGNFVLGSTKVRPRVEPSDGKPATFKKTQKVNFWMQVYNLALGDETKQVEGKPVTVKKPNASVEYEVVKTGAKEADRKTVLHAEENTEKMGNVGDQITLEKSVSLSDPRFEPGVYQIVIKVKDNVSNQTLTQTARFAVEAPAVAAVTTAPASTAAQK